MSAPGPAMRPLVVQAEELDPACAAWLAERCRVEPVPHTDPRFRAALAEAEALIVRTYTRVDAALLAEAPRLRVVGRAGVGLDNIDVEACRAAGVEVVHTPDANTAAVTELVFAFMLDALRPRVFLDRALPMDQWKALRAELIGERQLADCTIGVLGLGRVGKSVARVARAFGAAVLFHDLLDIPEGERAGAAGVNGRDELFARADILTVHIDNRPSNRGFVNADRLACMKPAAMLINAARGFVVDAEALAAHLRANPAARAILDVHDPEPIEPESPLLGLPNAYLTPHIGAATRSAHRNMSWVVRDVHRVLRGERPEHPAAVR